MAFRGCVQAGGTVVAHSGRCFEGNPPHLAPELYIANTALARDSSISIPVDITKHMSFAIAVAMVELLALPSTHPIPNYPHGLYDSATGSMVFDESHMVALPTASALSHAG